MEIHILLRHDVPDFHGKKFLFAVFQPGAHGLIDGQKIPLQIYDENAIGTLGDKGAVFFSLSRRACSASKRLMDTAAWFDQGFDLG